MRIMILLTVLVSFIIAGCSSSSNLPTQPDNLNLPQADYSTSETQILYTGTFEIDLETQTITSIDRQSDTVYDITWFLPDKCPGGCFRFWIVNTLGTILELELTLENPLAIQAYDLRVEYLNLHGKTLRNPDGYTDFLGSQIWDIHPFTAFATEYPDRAFPIGPGGIDTENIFVDYPPEAYPAVDYAITAHLPGMTPEPYEIGDMAQTGELTPDGGSAIISCRVDDHQDDVSNVYLDATPFTGAPVEMLPIAPGYYEIEISNTECAPVGEYTQLIMALSPNPQNISTYNYVTVSVTDAELIEVIAYTTGSGSSQQVFTIDPEGLTSPVKWTNCPPAFVENAKLSPCGHYILYSFCDMSVSDIILIDIQTGVETIITPSGKHAFGSDFSHDGTSIVSCVGNSWIDYKNIWTMDYNGENTEILTTGADAFEPDYNFDDSKIYFRNGLINSVVKIIDISSGAVTTYTDNGAYLNCSPAGNHDGTQIAFVYKETSSSSMPIYLSPVDSWTPPDKIIDFNHSLRSPCFSPDGSKLVLDYGGGSSIELAVYDLTTDTWTRITDNSWPDAEPDWGYIIPH